jgi:tetratricopeptide (TPR) repeat protein
MSTYRTNPLVSVAACFAIFLSPGLVPASDALDQEFNRIQKVIDTNCADCYGASRDAFVQAIGELEALVQAGYDNVEARKLLADSYRVRAVVYETRTTAEYDRLLQQEQALYAKLTDEFPDNVSVLTGYASTLRDHAKAIELLKRAEALAPRDAFVQHRLGVTYAGGLNDLDKAIPHLQRSVELEKYKKATYGEHLARTLEKKGDTAGATQVRAEMKAFEREMEERDRRKQQGARSEQEK